jgi:hypothetical protein
VEAILKKPVSPPHLLAVSDVSANEDGHNTRCAL